MAAQKVHHLFFFSVTLILVIVLVLPISSAHAFQETPTVIRVAPDGSQESNCGNTWENACDLQFTLQTLADDAGHEPVEVWVRRGTYFPTSDPQKRSAAFFLVNNVAIYGGFAGDGTEQNNSDRDWRKNPTILSGDIDHEDPNLQDLANPATDPVQIRGKNAYHVVVSLGTNTSSILDGFIITAGQSDGQAVDGQFVFDNRGGGMFNNGNLILKNLLFTGNTSSFLAGGIWNDRCSPTIINVTFHRNSVGYAGGGIANWYSNPILINNTFSENYVLDVDGDGAGLYNYTSSPILLNSTFYGNQASTGAGIYNRDESRPTLIHVSLVNNFADRFGGAILIDGTSNVSIRNSILWGNLPDQLFSSVGGSYQVSYSDVQNELDGPGNINIDPLLGPIGDYGGMVQTIPLLPGSPAINKIPIDHCTSYDGSRLNSDQRGLSRPQASFCDMGAYEFEFPYQIMLPIVQRYMR